MKRAAFLPLAVAVVLAGPTPSRAAVQKWNIEIGADAGYSHFDKRVELKDAGTTGFRLGLVLHPAFEVQAYYDTLSARKTDANQPNSDYHQTFTGVRVMGVFHAAEEARVYPYMLAGAGQVKTTFDSGNAGFAKQDDKSNFEDVGFGARIHIWKGLNANAELFMRHLRTLNETSSNTNVHGGISWILGKKK
jgi:outer membrane protein with beta-barrel domain